MSCYRKDEISALTDVKIRCGKIECDGHNLCVLKTSSVLIGRANRLNVSGDGRIAHVSLLRYGQFAAQSAKFPVPIFRELGGNALNLLANARACIAITCLKWQNFPIIIQFFSSAGSSAAGRKRALGSP